MSTEELLRSAVQKLGPERSEQALRAFDGTLDRAWDGCALALAYGAPGELRAAMAPLQERFPPGVRCRSAAAELLGLSLGEVSSITLAFDGGAQSRGTLRHALEAEAAKIHAPRAVAASEAAAPQEVEV